nr:RecName: Full=Gurmarin; AltName: Full=Sweet taste-suppressing peptide [Gymnema sylvestre]
QQCVKKDELCIPYYLDCCEPLECKKVNWWDHKCIG